MGCHALPQGIFLTQESNLGLLHCRQFLCSLSHQRSPHSYTQEGVKTTGLEFLQVWALGTFFKLLLQRLWKEEQWAQLLSPLKKSFLCIQCCFKAVPIEEMECENVHSQNSSRDSLLVHRVTQVWWKSMKIFLSFHSSCLFYMFVWRNS